MTVKQNISNLIQHHNGFEFFNYDISVDWAIDLIREGKETENILILASFSKPTNAVEIKPYVNAVLADLGLLLKERNEAVYALIHYYLVEILLNNSVRNNLSLLHEIYLEKDGIENNDNLGLTPFYLLYHAWRELEDIGHNYYYEGANLKNIEDLIKEQAQVWINQFINRIEIKPIKNRPKITKTNIIIALGLCLTATVITYGLLKPDYQKVDQLFKIRVRTNNVKWDYKGWYNQLDYLIIDSETIKKMQVENEITGFSMTGYRKDSLLFETKIIGKHFNKDSKKIMKTLQKGDRLIFDSIKVKINRKEMFAEGFYVKIAN